MGVGYLNLTKPRRTRRSHITPEKSKGGLGAGISGAVHRPARPKPIVQPSAVQQRYQSPKRPLTTQPESRAAHLREAVRGATADCGTSIFRSQPTKDGPRAHAPTQLRTSEGADSRVRILFTRVYMHSGRTWQDSLIIIYEQHHNKEARHDNCTRPWSKIEVQNG